MIASALTSNSFKGLPKRQYEYTLPSGYPDDQKEYQMPEVRKELASLDVERTLKEEKALCALQKALIDAQPYLSKAKRAQVAVQNATSKQLVGVQQKNNRIKKLLACCAQSAYQQDKHDAIWLFNRLSKSSKLDEQTSLYQMAQAFRELDRQHDANEIKRAETTLKRMYEKQSAVVQCDIQDLYGKNIDFSA